jgi:predicted DsbA family dithiol-disulfide isomerase
MSDETCCGACGYPIHATKESACDWCRQSADRIEALTAERDDHWKSFVHWRKEADDRAEQLEAARADAKEAEAYAEELEKENERLRRTIGAAGKLGRIIGFLGDDEERIAAFLEACGPELINSARVTLAEIEGGKG